MKLQITRLRVEQLRRFRAPFELDGFEPGLNIVAAANEAGKSTLVRAIRAAFFERHRSTQVEDLRPWGEGTGAAPQVELDFLLDGQPHRLMKSFLAKKRCVLDAGARSLEGTEAEDHLAQLFGFSFAAKGASRPENWGIPGLLWVEQGRGQELDVSHARDHLHDALRDPAGDAAAPLAASGGDALLDSLRAQRDELLTSTGKPRAAYAEVIEQAAALQAQRAALDAQITTYREQVDQLALMRQQHQADETARPWDALRAELQAAQTRNESLQAGQAQLLGDRARLRQLQETRDLLAKALEGLAQQQATAQARERAAEEAERQLRESDEAVAQARTQADAAQRRVDAAREAWRAASQEAQRRGLQQQLQQAQAEVARHAENLARAEEAQERLAALRATAASTPAIQPAELDRLLKLERAERDADLRRQAVATRLQFVLPEGQALRLQARGESHELRAEGERLVDAPATLHLPGGGQLIITPGGNDLAVLARQHADAREALQAALRSLGVDEVAQAQARQRAAADLEAQTRLAQQALAIVAPRGIDTLRGEHAQAQARHAGAQVALERLPAPPEGELPSMEEAEAAQEAAVAAEQALRKTLGEAQRRQSAAQGASEAARRELAAAQATLADPGRQQRQAQANQQLLAASAEADALAARIDLTETELQAARPDIVLQDIERLRRSIEQLMRGHQQRREQLLVLESGLQQAGAQGLEEQREALAGQLAQAQRRQADLQRRAEALSLLCRKLEQKRQATLTRLQAPLQARMQHYLPLLMPGATVEMDAGLAPAMLTRARLGGAVESGQLQELSFGAREQLRLISRFAYADLLQEAGRPTLLILDDALVHSDAPRLAQMKRVLFDAAQRHQVLLFTCHPEDWRDMGVALRPLA
ncbi:DNA repair exonuclease SbcCD ATPase subunit [Variovorax sp. PDC80]|uniref:AAA family ATPase n=1 Tax=Variovorax sp. PDC80 TaxID=1882827 RepID=UPI0008DED2D5|nr:AAA family ATPase [Variovorax sp. PDC80]SFP72535.1 DNA repair exonuclease SbcCD ATPase subunit [Variovorax sp. PDC80]